ncbi:MAG: LiaF-related protein [Candidatus Dojkabacteria bacterium]|jgi:predicted membrane protein|nr:LiaF-related protein [Candidatus Dojkabacteria bacterium]
MKEISKRYKSRDVVWAIFLIFVGSIFLLNTTGLLEWAIWLYILRFWPVFLILGGIKLVIGNSAIADIVLAIISLILFLTVAILAYSSYTPRNVLFFHGPVNRAITEQGSRFIQKRDSVEKQMVVAKGDFPDDVMSKKLELNIGAAYFELSDEDISNYLTVDSTYPGHFSSPNIDSKLVDGKLDMKFKSALSSGFMFMNNQRSEYDLVLGREDILTDLRISLGAGEGKVLLTDTVIGGIYSQVGAGRLVIDLSERSIPTEKISIDVGAGEVVLQLPEGVGYSLEYELGIGNISGDGKDIASFVGSDKKYESENFDLADIKVSIVAKVGVGSLVIESK